MKNSQIIIFSLLVGLMVSGLSYFIEINKGDYIFRGFPIGFYNAVWKMGFERDFSLQALLFNIAIWSFIIFIVVKLVLAIQKRYISQD